ncbi:ABC transporter substrate-binding protein [Nocardioides sp. R-C-SC26]|uniref:ABC transporter substrate-binding protein n=1 Tax=Nocardioides sp. R-C-SC26 TaxID=2870414 RepID=UPI001E5BE90C|nr:ABC transporter substrate-binding protein [Nocardioides sp. R-C-SC26]
MTACGTQLDPETVADAQRGPGTSFATSDVGVAPNAIVEDGLSGASTDGPLLPTEAEGPTTSDAPEFTGTDATGSMGGTSSGPENVPPIDVPSEARCQDIPPGPGITDNEIVLGNASDVSGPVPGLFEAAQDATQAFIAYFNATNDLCGHSLRLKTYDTRTDASADQQAYAAACREVFAMVGSMSAFDSGGASTAQSCGLPDFRTANVTAQRAACTTCFGAQSSRSGQWPKAFANFARREDPEGSRNAAMLYLNAGGAAENAKSEVRALEKLGMKFTYVQAIDVAEFDYASYVQQLKDRDIKVVFFVGAYQNSLRLRQTMAQVAYKPGIYFRDPTDYETAYVEQGGASVDGTTVALNFVPFEEAARSQEMSIYLSWLQQVKPGASPSFFGVFAWSATRLFVEQAVGLGAGLSRAALVKGLSRVKNWTSNGLHSPQQVGPKVLGDCWRFIRLEEGRWSPVGGNSYACDGLSVG